MPMTDAAAPIATASTRAPPRTWLRPAPMARSRADSRLRWAARIVNVLLMLNVATTRATPANARRKFFRKPRKSPWRSFSCSAVSSVPVTASASAGRTSAIWSRSSPSLRVPSPRTRSSETSPGVPNSSTARSGVKRGEGGAGHAGLLAEADQADELGLHGLGREDRGGVADGEAARRRRCAASMTTSSAASGARPEVTWYGLSLASSTQPRGVGGRSLAAERRAVGAQDLGGAGHLGRHGGDVRELARSWRPGWRRAAAAGGPGRC